MKRKNTEKKYCQFCGKEIVRKRYGKRLEDFARFCARKYCSLSCANTTKQPTESGYRWRAERMRKSHCEICGASSNLHAHHINGNIADNTPQNIQTLCIHCHAKHHHFTQKRGLAVAGKATLEEFAKMRKTELTASKQLEMARFQSWRQGRFAN